MVASGDLREGRLNESSRQGDCARDGEEMVILSRWLSLAKANRDLEQTLSGKTR